MKVSDALVLDARLMGEATQRSIAGQIEFWARLGRAVETLSGLLGDITSAGIVFPVDLRLRPGSKGSGFASSLAALG